MNPPSTAVGKTLARRRYLQVDPDRALPPDLEARLAAAETLSGRRRGPDFNVARFDLDGPAVALLAYPDLFADAFPALAASWLVDPDAGTVGHRTYAESANPPILHRKELLLPADHPRRAEFAALTAACESIGLFADPRRIGYRQQWLALIREQGYRIEDHELLPLGNDENDESDAEFSTLSPASRSDAGITAPSPAGRPDAEVTAPSPAGWQAARHLTALARQGFSAPVQSLARHGLLDGGWSLFDYGCGRGDDVRGLQANGLTAAGWDPHHAPERPIQSADIVNLGFVINVIEDPDERRAALARAWSLAQRLLVVSVMLANRQAPRGETFGDGVMTRRGTFQRYFTQAEIRQYLETVLETPAIPVAPGVLYVFRDQDAEQRFLLDRQRRQRRPGPFPGLLDPCPHPSWRPRAAPDGASGRDRPPRARSAGADRVRVDPAVAFHDAHRDACDRLWARWLDLGRPPEPDEAPDLEPLAEVRGSVAKLLRTLRQLRDPDGRLLAAAAEARATDLRVYFALQQFARRRPYRQLEPGLQRDIRALFGDHARALEEGRALLFGIADTQALAAACRQAAEQGLGWLDPEGRSLQLHASLIERLPALARVYVGCAAALHGDCREADLIKLHLASGKVSLMRYDDFLGSPLPRLVERVKIRLREQDIDYFVYGEDFAPPYLFHKSRYINEEFEQYPDQCAFEDELNALASQGLFDLSGYGPPPAVFDAALARHRWTLDGFRLARRPGAPDLDAPCGRYLSYRDLIECGETQAATGLANLPRCPDTWEALRALATRILDPTIEYFGMIRLTYGFCSPELARAIRARAGHGPIDPARDQHAAHEVNRRGRPICARLGAAADFIVEDESMFEVARWIAEHTPFDRLYLYGDDRPIHVSLGPERAGQIVRLRPGPSGRLVPRVIARDAIGRE